MRAAYIFAFTPFGTQTLTVNTTTGSFPNTAFATGWYDSTGFNDPSNQNYIISDPALGCAGCDGFSLSHTTHDFFAFRLGQGIITGTILSATLSVGNPISPNPGFLGPNGDLLVSLWDVTTPVSTLTAGGSGLTGIYNDLGTGSLFGSRVTSAADNGTQIAFNLNANALAAIAAASGVEGTSLFAIGGSISLASVPEPSTWALLGAGLLVLTLRRDSLKKRFRPQRNAN
jgi:hypothetical protein